MTKTIKEENTDTIEDTEEVKEPSVVEDVKKEQKNINDDNAKEKAGAMGALMKQISGVPEADSLVEGPVISVEKSAVYVDLGPFGTGIIYGKEFLSARDVIKKINIGDSVTAKVVEKENDDGYVELSLQEARKALVWSEAEEAIKNKTSFDLPIKEANKGGLIIEWQGVKGFLPASQLKPEHYPRIEDGDKNKIFEELKKLVSTNITVSIIGAEPKEDKLIFSEKESGKKEQKEIAEKYSLGDEVEGEVTGMVEFGVFIKIEEGLEGLVHISEIDWGLVDDLKKIFKVGDKVKAKIIEIKDGKISLSIKALKENPWEEAVKKYKKGDIVEGVVIKFNQYGALASIEEGVSGLVHISEFGTAEKLKEKLELGKSYPITLFDPKDQKMTLSFMDKEKETKTE
jgi:small subunit ribosomal protein S1